jgi:hypothetical protein
MEKIMFAKKKGVLLNDEIHEKLLKFRLIFLLRLVKGFLLKRLLNTF